MIGAPNYLLRIGLIEYGCWRDGSPFSLADCWRECDGVAGATILAASGRVVLDRAGEHVGRRYRVRAMYRAGVR